MEELFNILSSSARIDKTKRRKLNHTTTNTSKSGNNNNNNNTSLAHQLRQNNNDVTDDYNVSTTSANVDFPADATTSATSTTATTTTTATAMKSRDRTGKRDTSIEKLQQIHTEEIAAFRRSMNIQLRYNKNYYNIATPGSIADPISSFHELMTPTTSTTTNTATTTGPTTSATGRWWSDSNKNSIQQQQEQTQHCNNIYRAILRNIELGQWYEPTPIQMQLIPILIDNQYDCIGCATTGSGKSGAFIIPAIIIASLSHTMFYNNSNTDNNINTKKRKKNSKNQSTNDTLSTSVSGSEESHVGEIRVLIVVPSYELASQIHRETERLGHGTPGGMTCLLLGKANVMSLIQKTIGGKHGIDIIVTTPLRLCDAIQKGLSLNRVRFIVLDEADRLLDATDTGGSSFSSSSSSHRRRNSSNKPSESDEDDDECDDDDDMVYDNSTTNQPQRQISGTGQSQTFLSQMDIILNEIPNTAIRALFSATVTSHVRQLSESILRNPIDVTITTNKNSYCGSNPDIEQELLFVGREEGKLLAIRQLVARGQLRPPVIIFVQSQERAQALFTELLYDNIHIDVIHAGRSKSARELAVANFRRGNTWVLICTDLVARGVDFRAVNMVINYDLPTSGVTYIHRIGRTGRAGRKGGKAITLFTEIDFDNLRMIANVMRQSGCTVPDWMLQLKKQSKQRKKNNGAPIRRPDIDTTPSYDKKKLHKKQQIIQHNQQKKQHNATKEV